MAHSLTTLHTGLAGYRTGIDDHNIDRLIVSSSLYIARFKQRSANAFGLALVDLAAECFYYETFQSFLEKL